MITRKQSIDQFELYMDELINSNYILADKKISNLLKVVTSSKLFFELITYCAKDYDYQQVKILLDEGGELPMQNRKHLISFGFALFTLFDTKEEDLLDFLKKYYPCDKFDQSYKMFVDNFLIQFKNCTLEVAREMDSEISMLEELENEAQGEQIEMNIPLKFNSEKKEEVVHEEQKKKAEPHKKYLTCYRDIQKIIISEKGKIIHCKSVKDSDKNDLLKLLEKFRSCLFSGTKEDLKMSFISYKYAALAFKKIESEVDDIERILKFCGVV